MTDGWLPGSYLAPRKPGSAAQGTEPVRLVVIDASTSAGGRVATSAEATARAVENVGAKVTKISSTGTGSVAAELYNCGALIIVTPVYRATYPGDVKVCLDALEANALADKVMGWVAVGATPHHYVGIDQGMRSLAAWFGCLVPPTNSYLDASTFADDGKLVSAGIEEIRELAESVVFLASVTSGHKFGPRPLVLRKAPRRA